MHTKGTFTVLINQGHITLLLKFNFPSLIPPQKRQAGYAPTAFSQVFPLHRYLQCYLVIINDRFCLMVCCFLFNQPDLF